MTTEPLAHSGEHADLAAPAWRPEQVQSGSVGRRARPFTLAHALGWFSLGLGVAQLLAPRQVTRMIGAPDTSRTRALSRVMGARELMHGVGILSSPTPTPWVWTRVFGDVLDLAVLGRLVAGRAEDRSRAIGALAAVAGTTAIDLFDSLGLGRIEQAATATADDGPMIVKAAVTIDRSAHDIYSYWRDFENLPDIMTHLESVEYVGEGQTRWQARAPLGMSVHWTAEIIEDVPDEVIRWKSVGNSPVAVTGEVRLAPAPRDRGTELHVRFFYRAPIGAIGAAALKLFGDEPSQQVKDDLRRFKQVMETGQVVRSEGAPRGTDARMQPKQLPARPNAD